MRLVILKLFDELNEKACKEFACLKRKELVNVTTTKKLVNN